MKYYEPKRDVEKKVSCMQYVNASVGTHYHRSIELILVEKGTMFIQLTNKLTEFKPGEIAFIPSGFSHAVLKKNLSKSLTLMLPPNSYKAIAESGIKLLYHALKDTDKNKEIFDAVRELHSNINRQFLIIQGYVNIVLGLIYELYKDCNTTFESYYKTNDLMIEIMQYIESNFMDDITLDSISKHFGYSKYHFSRLFNKNFNCNLSVYINEVRSDAVKNSHSKNSKITENILDAGFGSISSYYRHKKK